MNLLLRDETNLQMNSSKRACTCKAVAIILQHTSSQKSCGHPVSGGVNRWCREPEVTDDTFSTLKQILKRNTIHHLSWELVCRLNEYVERNITMEIQMAFAIQNFSIAVKEWGEVSWRQPVVLLM